MTNKIKLKPFTLFVDNESNLEYNVVYQLHNHKNTMVITKSYSSRDDAKPKPLETIRTLSESSQIFEFLYKAKKDKKLKGTIANMERIYLDSLIYIDDIVLGLISENW